MTDKNGMTPAVARRALKRDAEDDEEETEMEEETTPKKSGKIKSDDGQQEEKEDDMKWMMKPSQGVRGHGMRYYRSTKKFMNEESMSFKTRSCGKKKGYLAQEYVDPALLDGRYKFDVRTWMLIASASPLIVFYHDGFIRVSSHPYDAKSADPFSHITNLRGQEGARPGNYYRGFRNASIQLEQTYGFPPNFMETVFAERIQKANIVAALAQMKLFYERRKTSNVDSNPDGTASLDADDDNGERDEGGEEVEEADSSSGSTKAKKQIPRGFYHLYACDSVVSRRGDVRLLECNSFPAEIEQRKARGNPDIFGEMIALVLNLHTEPWRLLNLPTPANRVGKECENKRGIWKKGAKISGDGEFTVASGYRFGKWKLIFNELETPLDEWDVCAAKASELVLNTPKRAAKKATKRIEDEDEDNDGGEGEEAV